MIKTFTGPMFASKSGELIKTYNKIYNKEHVLVFKPKLDDRDLGVIKSRDYDESIEAICIDSFYEIGDYINENTRTIFIDEAQMIKGSVRIISYLSIIKDIDFYIAGLNMTSEQEPFLTMPMILAISDEIVNIKASCYDCGREDALYSYHEGKKDGVLLVGSDGYMPLCAKCLRKRRGEDGMKLLLKNDTEK